jgi:hypothetical protein
MNRIVLFLEARSWHARFEGPHADTVLNLFGTTVVPTPFTSAANPAFVLEEIRKRNRGVKVEIAQNTGVAA